MNKEVRRYEHFGDYCGPQCGIEESERGCWVKSEDYDALLAERDRLQAKWVGVESERDRLIAEAGAFRKDAERYRWLRNNAHSSVDIDIGAGLEIGETLDAAIDDAMRQT